MSPFSRRLSAVSWLPFAAPPVPHRVVRSRRRTLSIRVEESGEVVVRAPKRMSETRIRRELERHRDWVLKTRDAALTRARRQAARRFVDGDTVTVLGEPLVLAVRDGPEQGVRRSDRRLEVTVLPAAGRTPAERGALVKALVGSWLLRLAQSEFHARHERAARAVGLRARSITVKHMRSRWGSCGPSRRMSLDWRLVMAPAEVVDYVIVHELVHIEVHDHSPRFWRRVAEACPHVRRSRTWLARHGADLVW